MADNPLLWRGKGWVKPVNYSRTSKVLLNYYAIKSFGGCLLTID